MSPLEVSPLEVSKGPREARARRAAWLAGLLAGCLACRAAEITSERQVPRPRRGAVVAEHALAAEVGVEVLERGGNAADAAIAAALALAVVLPQAGNLGGGGFAVWVGYGGEARTLDFREAAPAAARPELYLDGPGLVAAERAREGVLSVGVPGTPAGLFELHAKLGSGRFTFEALAEPAIALAREGFQVDARLAETLAEPTVRARLFGNAAARELFYPGGEPLEEGDLLVQGALAETLERYARRGPAEFVDGPTALALVAELDTQARLAGPSALGGPSQVGAQGRWIALEDLAAYRPIWREPLRGWFRGHEVITVPPPSSGGLILLQTLAVLDGFPLDAERRSALDGPGVGLGGAQASDATGLGERAVHWWIETLRRAFAERAAHLGDPDQHPVPLELLLSPVWVAHARMAIGETANAEGVLPTPLAEGQETTHLSVLDPSGSAVSLTTTLNSSFGSGILVRGAGFLLNNELDDFSLPHATPNQFALVGGAANLIGPGKRPLSSLAPTILLGENGAVALVLGSPGGPRIATTVTAICLRVLVYGASLSEAVAAPRFHQQWSPSATEFEPGWPPLLLEALRRRGHEVREVDARFGGVQAIQVLPGGEVVGVSDPRRLGGVAETLERRRAPERDPDAAKPPPRRRAL